MSRRLYSLAAVFLVAMAAAIAVDIPVAAFCRAYELPGFFHKLLSFAEVFAHGLGVACILLTVFVLDVSRRRRLARIITNVVAAGLLVDAVKLVIGRLRPRAVVVDDVWNSFLGWFPNLSLDRPPGVSSSDFQSFPSGHAAVATALAIGLSSLYPRGRWLFMCFAVLASLQRVEALAHYLSDTMAGAALACLICAIGFDRRLSGRWFDRWEAPGISNRCDFPDKPIG